MCPVCGSFGVSRERRPNGNDKCAQGHVYPSRLAVGCEQAMTPTDFHSPLLPDDGERRSERGLLPMRDEAELFDASGEPLF